MHPDNSDAELVVALRAQLAEIDEQRRRAEEALRESERRYQLAARAGQVGVWDWDLSTNAIYLDPNLKAMLGYADHEIRNHMDDWSRLVHPEDVAAVMERANAHLAGKTPYYEAEHRMRHKDGSVCWFLARGTAIRAPDGTPLRLVGTDTNITDSHRVEIERDRLFDLSIDLLCVAGFDGFFKQVNPAWTRSLGWSASELLEVPWLDMVHPDDRDSTFQAGERLQVGAAVLNFENRYRCKDGSYRWLSWNSFPLQEERLILAAVRDITQQKEMEQLAAEGARRYQSIIESIPLGIFVYQLDDAGRLVFSDTNPAASAILGVDTRQFIGLTLEEAFPPLINTEVPDRYRLAAGYGVPWYTEQIDYEYGEITGGYEVHAFQSLPGQMVVAFQDITERRQMEQERLLVAMERERGNVLQEFISNASHDLNTPLTALKTSLYVLRRLLKCPLGDSSQALRHVGIMEAQADRLEKLWRDLLHMSRLKMATDFHFITLDVNQLMQHILHELHDLITRRRHTLSFTPASDLPPISGDLANLERALSAIVTNALLYTPAGGSIRVYTLMQDNYTCIEVRDNGIGIDAGALPHIFDHFFRADAARSTETGGAGLGLAIAKKVIDVHNGRIEVESTPGVGSTFRVLLPASVVGSTCAHWA